jgi:hypothetical protein
LGWTDKEIPRLRSVPFRHILNQDTSSSLRSVLWHGSWNARIIEPERNCPLLGNGSINTYRDNGYVRENRGTVGNCVFCVVCLEATYWHQDRLADCTLNERPSILIRDKPIFSSERILHKDYYRRSSVEKENLWSWVSRGLTPRRTDWL